MFLHHVSLFLSVCSYTPCSLTLVPEVVQQIVEQKQDDERGPQSKKLILTAPDWKTRDDYHAFSSVKELEKHVSQKYDSCISQNQPNTTGDKNIKYIATSSPVSILFNECSFGAFSRWAAASNDTTDHFNDAQTTYYYPTSTPLFRKCLICHCYGHYEMECQEMTESSLLRTVEPHLRAQVMMNKLAPDITTGSSCFPSPTFYVANLAPGEPFLSNETAIPTLEESIVPLSKQRRIRNNEQPSSIDDLHDPSHLTDYAIHVTKENCSVCHLSLHKKDQLSCYSCNKLFHYQCLKELGGLRSGTGEWFCEACLSYDSDVSSTVDIEPCDGFIIEQRKKSSTERPNIGNTTFGFHDTGWTCAISVSVREQPSSKVATTINNNTLPPVNDNSNDKNISDAPKHQHPYGSWDDAVVDDLDGIKIFSKPLEDSCSETLSEVPLFHSATYSREQAETFNVLPAKSVSEVSHPFEEISKHGLSPEILIGALVTWSIPSKDVVSGEQNFGDTKRLNESGTFTSSSISAHKYFTNKRSRSNGQSKSRQMIGSVVTLDHFNMFALIRLLPDSGEVITELGRILHNTSQSSSSSAICRTAIGSCNLGASIWVPVKSLSLIQAVRDTSVKEKAQYNLINALKSEHLKRKNMSCTLHDEQQRKKMVSITLPSGESPAQIDESDVFQAERIIDERINADTSMKEYYIKWKGYDVKDSTWVSEVIAINNVCLKGMDIFFSFSLSHCCSIPHGPIIVFPTSRETLSHRILFRFLQ